MGVSTCLKQNILRSVHGLRELVDPAQCFFRGLSTGNERLGLLVLLEMPNTKLVFKGSHMAMTDKPDEVPPILSRELFRAPEPN